MDTSLDERGINIKVIYDSLKEDKSVAEYPLILRDSPFVGKFESYPIPPNKTFSIGGLDTLLYLNYYMYIAEEIKFRDMQSGKTGRKYPGQFVQVIFF